MLGDAELIEGCLSQDKKAQRMLYSKYASTMFGICLRYCKRRAEAEDILQEAFVKIFTNMKTYRSEGSFEGWLKRIVVNTALNYYKSQLKHCFDEPIEENQKIQLATEPMQGSDISAEELLKLINSLADGYRIVFNLYAVEGYSHKEIASILNISENTSKSQLSRARAILQEKVNAYRKMMIHP